MNARRAITQGRPVKTQKKTPFGELAFDLEPIAGVGESLLIVEAEFRKIDEAARLRCLEITIKECQELLK